MTTDDRKRDLIEQAAKAMEDVRIGVNSFLSPGLATTLAEAAIAVFEAAHAKELDTSPERVKNGADSSHVEAAQKPTDDERKALANLIPLGFTDRDPVQNVFQAADRILAAGFRRPVSPEPSAHGCCLHDAKVIERPDFEMPDPLSEQQDEPTDDEREDAKGGQVRAVERIIQRGGGEPQGEPTDAEVLAALNAAQEEDWRQSGYKNQPIVSTSLTDWHWRNVARMRAALRAAAEEGKNRDA